MKHSITKKEFPIIETRICLRCGEPFGITCRQKMKKYCSNCKEIHQYEHRHSEGYVQRQKQFAKKYHENNRYIPKRHIMICDRCNKEFIAGSGNATICIECLRKSDKVNERMRATYRRDYTESGERIRISSRYYTSEN